MLSKRLARAGAVLLTLGAAGCGVDLTGPTNAPDVYSGLWRGTVGDFRVVLSVRAERGTGFGLNGEAICTHQSTGDEKRLRLGGFATGTSVTVNFFTPESRPDEFLGQFSGRMPDGRSMTGEFRGPRSAGRSYDGVLGIEQGAVSFAKD